MFQNQSNNIQNNQINNMPNNQPIAKPTVQTEFNNTNTSNNQPVKLKRFKYKVKEADGKIIESFFDAENKVDVESFLLNKGYQIIEITEDKLSASLGLIGASTSKKMSSKDLNFFLTQLSTYVKSGIPLLDSMEILSRQSKKKNIAMLYRKIVFDLNRGVSFSDCLAKQGKVFPKMLINMLKTSEMTGDLTGVLDDMAAYYKRQDSNRKQIINAMTYPSVLMVFAVAVLTFVITYVVPSFTSMYESTGSSLPGITVAIINISNFVTGNWYYILGGIIVVVTLFTLIYKSSTGFKYATQSFLMHIPVVKDIIKYNQLVTFTSTFSTLIKHDVFITDSMDILSKITENEVYKKIINNAIENLSKGNGVSVAFKGHWAFPETAYEMLLTGEKTGKLGEMMEHVSTYYQEEQTNIIARLKSLIEPVMIVLLAVIVGVILLAVVVPMFDIYSTII
ncbi:MAG: type II secretion system F family protein [Bacilli bacterium]|nr:type II secretion system F family protein [bacterium]MDY3934531.1 type II secretion system F family protein [Bacilli bacterium]